MTKFTCRRCRKEAMDRSVIRVQVWGQGERLSGGHYQREGSSGVSRTICKTCAEDLFIELANFVEEEVDSPTPA